MTNGEKIKEIFPNGVLTSINNSYYWGDDILVSKNWWNAEYKEPTTKNNKVDCQHTDCKNCVNHKYCDYESTTKNDLGVDTVSREKAIAWAKYFSNIYDAKTANESIMGMLRDLPSVTPQDIDYKAQYERLSQKAEIVITQLRADRDRLMSLPPVTPIRPKGHWIDTKENSTNTRGQIIHEVICSECNGIAYFRSIGNKYIGANICPNCGSYNGGDSNGNE